MFNIAWWCHWLSFNIKPAFEAPKSFCWTPLGDWLWYWFISVWFWYCVLFVWKQEAKTINRNHKIWYGDGNTFPESFNIFCRSFIFRPELTSLLLMQCLEGAPWATVSEGIFYLNTKKEQRMSEKRQGNGIRYLVCCSNVILLWRLGFDKGIGRWLRGFVHWNASPYTMICI